MVNNEPLLPDMRRVPSVTRQTPADPGAPVLSTRDPEIIRAWANKVGAEPATGEETPSGPATAMKVADEGTGLRFNFPGMGRFRTITWPEWLDHFNRYDLTFIYDNVRPGQPPSARYRLVETRKLSGV